MAHTNPPVKRPSVDAWALGIAQAVSTRGDCTRRQVGCVILDARRRAVSIGYNGAPPGAPGCLTDGACPRGRRSHEVTPPGAAYDDCVALHAEQNALIWADPLRLQGAVVYVSTAPCEWCLKLLRGSGVSRVVWPEGTIDFA